MEKLAIHGGNPVRTAPFPNSSWPVFDELEVRLLTEVVHSGKWGGSGDVSSGDFRPKIPQFERQFADMHAAKYGIAVFNGTVAITVALQAAGVKHGDEVIMPPYTFIATAAAALAFGAIPVFADIEADTLLIDPERAEALITPRTKAIVAVHIAGCPADMTRLSEIAKRRGLALIEDAAQAVGASWDGRPVGALGDLGTFSLQSSKNLTSGEGGIVTTNHEAYWDRAWSLCNAGRVLGGQWYQHERLGQNYRMTEFQAAVALAGMTRLEGQMQVRERNVELLDGLLGQVDGIRLLKRDPRVTRHAHHLYMFKIDPALADKIDKDDFAAKVQAEGVPITTGYVSLNRNPAIVEATKDWEGRERVFDCPVSERMCDKEVFWFTKNTLGSDEAAMRDIAAALDKVIRSY